MKTRKMYRYLGRNGILTTLILLDGINHIPMYELKADPGYILTNGKEFKHVITVFEDEVANWHEVADNTDK